MGGAVTLTSRPQAVVVEQGVEEERVGDGGAPRYRVVAEAGEVAERIGDGLHAPVVGRYLDVDEGEARAVALGDAGNALAAAVVGVGGDVGLGVGDGVVGRSQVDGDGLQPVAGVVAVADAGDRGGDAGIEVDGADLRQLVAGVVVEGLLAVGAADAREVAARVIPVGQPVAERVLAGHEPATVGCVVALDHARVAVGPDVVAGRSLVDDLVVGAGAFGGDVSTSAVGVRCLGTVPVGPGQGAAAVLTTPTRRICCA
jgi:hypothetical protein